MFSPGGMRNNYRLPDVGSRTRKPAHKTYRGPGLSCSTVSDLARFIGCATGQEEQYNMLPLLRLQGMVL